MDCKKVRVLSEEEIKLLLNTLEGRNRIVVLLGLCVGLRSDEVFRLRWNDINFEKGLLKIYCKKQGKIVFVSLTKALIAELKNYITNYTGDRLFEDQSTEYFIRYFRMLNRKFNLLLSGDVTFKTLRHTFATHPIKAGIPIHIVSNVLGHTNNTMMEKEACIDALVN